MKNSYKENVNFGRIKMTHLRGQSNYKEVYCLNLLIVIVTENGIELYMYFQYADGC